MNYQAAQYFNQDTSRYQWAVFCSISHCWYFANRYGKKAALALANSMNNEAIV